MLFPRQAMPVHRSLHTSPRIADARGVEGSQGYIDYARGTPYGNSGYTGMCSYRQIPKMLAPGVGVTETECTGSSCMNGYGKCVQKYSMINANGTAYSYKSGCECQINQNSGLYGMVTPGPARW